MRQGQPERAIRGTLVAYLTAHPEAAPHAWVKVARVQYSKDETPSVSIVGAAAMVGSRTNDRDAAPWWKARRNPIARSPDRAQETFPELPAPCSGLPR